MRNWKGFVARRPALPHQAGRTAFPVPLITKSPREKLLCVKRGDLVADRFEIVHLAGTGGMGSVYQAIERASGRLVALKMLRVGADSDLIDRFALEAQVLAQFSHPSIVRYIAHGSLVDELYLAMEWLEGTTLLERLRTGLTLGESVSVARRVAEALGVAHQQGIVHRDIKPANLFLVGNDVNDVRLLDFGVARLRSAQTGMTQTGMMIGTPGYMAPEQVRCEKTIDARVDVFALGCVLYRCLTGKNPFWAEDPVAVLVKIVLEDVPRAREIQPSIPEVLDDLVAEMLSKNPAQRPADGRAVLARLAAIGNLANAHARPERIAPSLTSEERRMICFLLARATRDSRVLDRSIDTLRTEIASRGGRLDVLPDGLLLVTFPKTGTPADQAARAARCALAMRSIVTDLPMVLVAGEGVVTGRVPIGAVIDRGAALLAAAAPDGPVRVDEVIAGFLDRRFEVRAEGGGFSLVAERDDASTARMLLGKPSMCVGRDRELATLEATWEECLDEPVARVALVSAPAGIGKSRVREEFLRRIGSRSEWAEIWIGRGDSMSAGSPFGLVAEVIRRAAGVRLGAPLAERQQKLRERIAGAVPGKDAQRVTEFLGELIDTPFPDADRLELRAARSDPKLMGDQMRRAWEEWLAGESVNNPILLVLEDLHWGDLPSVTFVEAALRHLAGKAFMVLALARPEVHTLFPSLWSEQNMIELRLPPLTPKASSKLVREVLGAVSEEVVGRIVDRAGGNPFYLEEIMRAAVEGSDEASPGTVLAMVQARLDALEPEARRVLRAASVFGKRFPQGGVIDLLGGDDGPTLQRDWFGDLVAREIIVRPADPRFPDEYVFRHALIQEAAYAMLTEADRKLGHRLAAEWLERTGLCDVVVLAEHCERAGEPSRAIGWFRRAAEQALEGNDLRAVIQWVGRAIACGANGEDEGGLRLIESEAHRWRGEHEASHVAAARAFRLLRRGSAGWCDAAGTLAIADGALGNTEALAALANELGTIEPEPGNVSPLVNALARLARPLFWAGQHGVASRVLARAGSIADQAEGLPPATLVAVFVARGLEARLFGDPAECVNWNLIAVEESERAGDRRVGCVQRGNLGFAYLEIGAYAEAERTLQQSLASAERFGLTLTAATARQNLGLALARRGSLDEALRLESESLAAFEATGDLRRAGASLVYLALIQIDRGAFEQAEQSARRAIECLVSSAPLRCNALAVLASILLQRGDIEGASAAAAKARVQLERLGAIDEGESIVRLTYAETLRASGDLDGARVAIASARDRLLERAARFRDDAQRKRFLEAIPENARTLEWGRSSTF